MLLQLLKISNGRFVTVEVELKTYNDIQILNTWTGNTSYITQVATLRRENPLVDLHDSLFVFVAESFASAMGFVHSTHDLAMSQQLYFLPEIQEKIMLKQGMYLIRETRETIKYSGENQLQSVHFFIDQSWSSLLPLVHYLIHLEFKFYRLIM